MNKNKPTHNWKDIRYKMWFITLPQCDILPVDALKLLKKVFKHEIVRYQIAREVHKGGHGPKGTYHLHIFLQFEKVTNLPKKRFEKLLAKGNYQGVRSPAAVLGYIAKDGEPLGNFNLFIEAWSYKGSKDMLFKSILNAGWKPAEILSRFHNEIWATNFPSLLRKSFLINDARMSECMRSKSGFVKIDNKLIKSRLSTKELRKFRSFKGYSRLIAHINEIEEYGYSQPHKPKVNLLVTGYTAIGKSKLFNKLEEFIATYPFPIDNWHPDYEDHLYKLILWDEPKMMPKLKEFYLLFLDGLRTDLPVKGSRALRHDHQKIIMLSNLSLSSLCKKARYEGEQYHAFMRRLDTIDFKRRNLDFLQKLFVKKDSNKK